MHILLLEDAKSTQLLIKKRLEKEGYEVDAIISDIRMPHWDGF